MKFCPNCGIGLSNEEKKVKFCKNCKTDFEQDKTEDKEDVYDSIYMEVVELVEKDNIQCEFYSETAKKLKEKYSITRK